MKRFLILVGLVTLYSTTYAQKTHKGVKQTVNLFLDFGVKGFVGSSVFVNSNLFSDANYNHSFAGSYAFGGKVALDFGDHAALVSEVLYTRVNQKFNVSSDVSLAKWTNTIAISELSIPLLIRKNNPETGSYAEFGAQFNKLMRVNEKGLFSNNSTSSYKNHWSAVFGFGGYLWGTNNFGISTGLRFVYSFQDILKSNTSITPSEYAQNAFSYADYQKTTPLSVFFVIEANYDLGFIIAKNECTGRRKFLFYN